MRLFVLVSVIVSVSLATRDSVRYPAIASSATTRTWRYAPDSPFNAQPPPLLPPATSATSHPADESDRPLSNRRGARRDEAIRKFGGDGQTERAVADGLAWLAAHQRPDGAWDRERFSDACPADDRCGGEGLVRAGHDMNVGVSGLALLAFLGAGHTHERGPYAKHITRAYEYIIAQQTPDGTFSPTSELQLYNDALAALAIAEAYVLTRDPVLERPMRRAVSHLVRAQQPQGGWDYLASRSVRTDTSIAGWVMMAFKSAAAAGVPAPNAALFSMLAHFDRATQADGQVWYANTGEGTELNKATGERILRFGPAMTAVGLFAHETIGWRSDDPVAVLQARSLLADPPSYEKLTRTDPTGLHSEYYWYYGTLAMFHRGGAEWAAWNRSMKNCILEYQDRSTRRNGTRKHTYGSWPPYGQKWGKWGKMGGRIYTTAINVLSLEIYYRYVPEYLSPHGLIGPTELREYVLSVPLAKRRDLIGTVSRFSPDTAEPILYEMLSMENAPTRLGAAIALTGLGSPSGRAELLAQQESTVGTIRERVIEALQKIERIPADRSFGSITRVSPQAGMVLFDMAENTPFYGESLRIMRDGRQVAAARVDRRFTKQRSAAATLANPNADVREGDRVQSGS